MRGDQEADSTSYKRELQDKKGANKCDTARQRIVIHLLRDLCKVLP